MVTAAAAAYYFGIGNTPRIDVQKLTNGEDADLPHAAPPLLAGAPCPADRIVRAHQDGADRGRRRYRVARSRIGRPSPPGRIVFTACSVQRMGDSPSRG